MNRLLRGRAAPNCLCTGTKFFHSKKMLFRSGTPYQHKKCNSKNVTDSPPYWHGGCYGSVFHLGEGRYCVYFLSCCIYCFYLFAAYTVKEYLLTSPSRTAWLAIRYPLLSHAAFATKVSIPFQHCRKPGSAAYFTKPFTFS